MKNLKNKRVEILHQIDLLNKKRCDNCKGVQGNDSNTERVMMCQCDAAIKVRKLGDSLDKLLTKRVWETKLENIKKIRVLTVNDYLDLRDYGIPDTDIMGALKLSRSVFQRRKVEIGLSYLRKTSDEKIQEFRRTKGHEIIMGVKRRV